MPRTPNAENAKHRKPRAPNAENSPIFVFANLQNTSFSFDVSSESSLTYGQCYKGNIFLVALHFSFLLCSSSGMVNYRWTVQNKATAAQLQCRTNSALQHRCTQDVQLKCRRTYAVAGQCRRTDAVLITV
jgi:hypothetical protein